MAEVTGTDINVEEIFAPHSLGLKEKSGSHTTVGVDVNGKYWGETCKGCQAHIGNMFLFGHVHDYHGYSEKFGYLAAIYSSLWRRDDQTVDEALAYWRYCLSDHYSPWRNAAKDSEIIYKDGIPIAYKLVNMDAPCQEIANLCFAMRMPYAQDGYLRMFSALRDKGFNRTESLFIAANVGLSPKGVLRYPYIGDYPFDTAWRDISWERWSTGTPNANKKNTIKALRPTYIPCNSIWTEGTTTGCNYSELGRKPSIVQKLITSGEEEYKGSFKSQYNKAATIKKTVSFDEAVKILRKNEDKWKVG